MFVKIIYNKSTWQKRRLPLCPDRKNPILGFLTSVHDIRMVHEVLMRIAYVVGTVVATMKDEKLRGRKLLLVREADLAGKPTGDPFVAVDTVDAGKGELVVVTEGSAARQTGFTEGLPVDAVIIAVVDTLETGGKVSFTKA
jgi:microcompartment protein CcmK/EutM